MRASGAGVGGETLAPPLDQRLARVYSGIAQYYSQKVLAHGATPLGVDWTCQPTQELRFVQLLKLCDFSQPFSLNDVGCGYGALLTFLAKRHRAAKVDYLGIDLSQAMIDQAMPSRHANISSQFVITGSVPRVANYSVASGIFNVRMNEPDTRWTLFIKKTLCDMHAASSLGFAVNFLASLPSDAHQVPELYRTSSDVWTSYCRHQFNAKVDVVADYGMHEFTLFVRR